MQGTGNMLLFLWPPFALPNMLRNKQQRRNHTLIFKAMASKLESRLLVQDNI